MDDYYNTTAPGYEELHKEEQLKKLAIIKQHLKINKNTKLLDVGCGTGVSSNFDCNVTGIDPSEELLKIAKKNNPKIKFIKAPAENMPFENNSFDVIVSITAIQNFDSIEKGLKEIKRVGKDKFAFTYLKKSKKAAEIEQLIKEIFGKMHRIEEEKDIIFINA